MKEGAKAASQTQSLWHKRLFFQNCSCACHPVTRYAYLVIRAYLPASDQPAWWAEYAPASAYIADLHRILPFSFSFYSLFRAMIASHTALQPPSSKPGRATPFFLHISNSHRHMTLTNLQLTTQRSLPKTPRPPLDSSPNRFSPHGLLRGAQIRLRQPLRRGGRQRRIPRFQRRQRKRPKAGGADWRVQVVFVRESVEGGV